MHGRIFGKQRQGLGQRGFGIVQPARPQIGFAQQLPFFGAAFLGRHALGHAGRKIGPSRFERARNNQIPQRRFIGLEKQGLLIGAERGLQQSFVIVVVPQNVILQGKLVRVQVYLGHRCGLFWRCAAAQKKERPQHQQKSRWKNAAAKGDLV